MNIALIGYPGAGKGTQARALARKLGLVHVSFGDIFWKEVALKTPLGHEVIDNLAAGNLVPDWLVMNQLKERYAKEKRGLIFDGFPRNGGQADSLEGWLSARSSRLDAAVLLKLPEAEAAKRLAERRLCPGCGLIYNRLAAPPFLEGICDSCAGKLASRDDDKPESVKRRLMVYRDQTEPLLSWFRGNSELYEINAMQSPQTVTGQILAALKVQG